MASGPAREAEPRPEGLSERAVETRRGPARGVVWAVLISSVAFWAPLAALVAYLVARR